MLHPFLSFWGKRKKQRKTTSRFAEFVETAKRCGLAPPFLRCPFCENGFYGIQKLARPGAAGVVFEEVLAAFSGNGFNFLGMGEIVGEFLFKVVEIFKKDGRLAVYEIVGHADGQLFREEHAAVGGQFPIAYGVESEAEEAHADFRTRQDSDVFALVVAAVEGEAKGLCEVVEVKAPEAALAFPRPKQHLASVETNLIGYEAIRIGEG